jgi:hypothetical protein
MQRFLIATAVSLAIMSSAHATGIGDIITFTQYNNGFPVAGCTNADDARQANKLWRDEYGTLRFVEWVQKLDDDQRVCIILSDNPKHEWKVVDKQVVKSSSANAWYCLESTIDYRDKTESGWLTKQKPYCFWVRMINK